MIIGNIAKAYETLKIAPAIVVPVWNVFLSMKLNFCSTDTFLKRTSAYTHNQYTEYGWGATKAWVKIVIAGEVI